MHGQPRHLLLHPSGPRWSALTAALVRFVRQPPAGTPLAGLALVERAGGQRTDGESEPDNF